MKYNNAHYQPVKKMYILDRVLIKKESDNLGLVPYNFEVSAINDNYSKPHAKTNLLIV